jgi:hypothetical protein
LLERRKERPLAREEEGMVRSVTHRRPVALYVLALAVALAALIVAVPQRAAAQHEDCTLRAFPPGPYAGIMTTSSTSVECATVKNVIHVSLVLTMDGAFVDSSDRTCHKRADCPTYTIVNDPPGNQAWCDTVSARVGPHAYPEVTLCESEESP